MSDWINYVFVLIIIKNIIWGGDYNFYNHFKYGKHYNEWYENKPTYKPPKDKDK